LYAAAVFTTIQRLTLVGIQALTSRPLNELGNLKYLWMDLTTFDNPDLGELLNPSLEELCISHHGLSHFSMRSSPQLPNLRVLRITPYELRLFEGASLPALQKAILNPPAAAPSPSKFDKSIQQLTSIFRPVEEIELRNWSWKESPWTATHLVEKLLPNLPSLIDIKFIQCFIDGEDLIKILSKQQAGRPKISITFDQCNGITRVDCEALFNPDTGLVVSLSVYV
jgi:hypothetical protein